MEILELRHQITVLERQLGKARPRFSAVDRAFLAALLHWLPRDLLGRIRLLIRPDTVLRRHRDLLARRHTARSRPKRPGRPRTVRSIRLLVLRLAGGRTHAGVTAASTGSSSTLARYRIMPGHVLHVTGVISPESVRCLVGRACSKGLLAVEIRVDRRRYQAVALNTKNSCKQA
jgi:hypothetical protein